MGTNTEGKKRVFLFKYEVSGCSLLQKTRYESYMLLFRPVNLKIPFDPGLLCHQFGINQNT